MALLSASPHYPYSGSLPPSPVPLSLSRYFEFLDRFFFIRINFEWLYEDVAEDKKAEASASFVHPSAIVHPNAVIGRVPLTTFFSVHFCSFLFFLFIPSLSPLNVLDLGFDRLLLENEVVIVRVDWN